MRWSVALSLTLAACGPAPSDPSTCLADAPGPFVRDRGNPALAAGYTQDGLVDTLIADPDLRWDRSTGLFTLYSLAPRGVSQASALTQTVRRATSPDAVDWTIAPVLALEAAPSATAWDHQNTETPSVAFDPDAPADRRYALVYSGAPADGEPLGFPSYAIGLAFSADGETFARLPGAESPHGEAGLILTVGDVYPHSESGVVADPEVAFHDGVWHLWFSSFGCSAGCTVVDAFGVGHATSTDAVHWTVEEAPLADLLRDPANPATGGSQPSATWDAARCQWELYFTSNPGTTDDQPVAFNNTAGVYRATSPDGAHWNADLDVPVLAWDPDQPSERLGLLTGADVTHTDDGAVMVYVGFSDDDVPPGLYLPVHSWFDPAGFVAGTTTLNVARR